MKINKKDVRRILLITLTNIGDIILTTPLITALDKEFPNARLDVMTGPQGRDIFIHHPRIFKVIIYNKHIPLREKRRLIRKLKVIKYDLVVDLKNTLFPLLIGSKYRTSPIQTVPENVVHKKDFHLYKLKTLNIDVHDASFSIYVSKRDQDYIDALIEKIPDKKRLVLVSPTAKSLIKRWEKTSFAEVANRLMEELDMTVAMIGDHADRDIIDDIISEMKSKPYNFAGMTTIPQLAHLIKKSQLLITNDSAPMHLGSAVGTKVLAIFGPTDPNKYRPLGKENRVIRKNLFCSPCEIAQCKFKHECMKQISTDEVYKTAKGMLK